MGTDVHAIFQARDGDKWKDVPSTWDQDRHYFLFSWLADVRNGHGFAGTPTYTPIKPIAEPRGLPDDFAGGQEHPTVIEALAPHRQKWAKEEKEDPPIADMGDHSFSWLTADEILSTPAPDRVWRTGIVTREVFDAWDGHTPFESWSGGISGGGVVVAESPTGVTPESTHVRVWWMQPGDTLKYFTDEIARLKAEYGDVRMVFGFDS